MIRPRRPSEYGSDRQRGGASGCSGLLSRGNSLLKPGVDWLGGTGMYEIILFISSRGKMTGTFLLPEGRSSAQVDLMTTRDRTPPSSLIRDLAANPFKSI